MPTQSKTTLGAVLYARVSTEAQAEQGTSLDEQIDVCRAKAASLDLLIIKEYRDEGISGASLVLRKGLHDAIADIREGRAGTLIAANMSRYSRDTEHQQKIKKDVQSAGGRVVFCDMDFDDTPEGDLAFGIMGNFAQYERQVIRKRTMAGRRRRAQQDGQQPCRTWSPYGYHIVNNAEVTSRLYAREQVGKYIIVEEQAQRVREIFARYADGESLQDIAKWLNTAEVPTPRNGRYWMRASLMSILKNEAYKGTPVFSKWYRQSDESRLEQGYKQPFKQTIRPQEEWIYLRCEPLVDEIIWEHCQRRLADGRARYSGNPKRKYLLSGILRCPFCGRGMSGTYDKSRHYMRYHCREAVKSRQYTTKAQCDPRTYNGVHAETSVVWTLREVVQKPKLMEEAFRVWCAEKLGLDGQQEEEANRLQKSIQELAVKERRTAEAHIACIEAGVDPTIYTTILREVKEKQFTLAAQLKRVGKQQEAQEHARASASVLDALAAVEKALTAPEITDAEKHDLLARVVESVTPEGEGYRLQLAALPGSLSVNVVLTLWNSREDFLNWVRSDAFTKGHAQSGTLPRDAYPQPNVLEMHEVVSDSSRPDLAPEPPGGPFKMH